MGTYFHTYFEAKADSIKELERTMKINEHVLRCMHTVLDSRDAMTAHIEKYVTVLKGSTERDQEREAKAQARRQAFSSRGPRDRDSRPPRDRDSRGSRD